MKTLILVLLVLMACKKKDVAPTPEPEPIVIPADTGCKTGTTWFAGKYLYNSDTITVAFVKNNCPTKNSNTYEMSGLKKAMAALTPTDVTIAEPLTTVSEELQKKMYDKLKSYNFFNLGDTLLRMTTSKLTSSQFDFKRIR